jgi:hypothetical protein
MNKSASALRELYVRTTRRSSLQTERNSKNSHRKDGSWERKEKINMMWRSFLPGDTIYIQRGVQEDSGRVQESKTEYDCCTQANAPQHR